MFSREMFGSTVIAGFLRGASWARGSGWAGGCRFDYWRLAGGDESAVSYVVFCACDGYGARRPRRLRRMLRTIAPARSRATPAATSAQHSVERLSGIADGGGWVT